jgi:hypothetical protein
MLVSIARKVFWKSSRDFTAKEAAFADAVWMLAAVVIWGVSMLVM